MMYRNTKTGAVIEVSSEIKGGDWVPVAEKTAPARKRKGTEKK